MGPENKQSDSTHRMKRWIVVWFAIRIIGIASLFLALVFTLISPVLGVALILAFLVGSNFVLRFVAKVSLRGILAYAIYVCALLVLLALWFFSIIDVIDVVVIVVPLALGYLVLSYAGKLR